MGQESSEWRSLLRNMWDPFILLPPGRSKYCSVITSSKSPSRCHRDKALCSGYLLLELAVTRASTKNMCLLWGLFLKDLFLTFRGVAAWSYLHLPLRNCFSNSLCFFCPQKLTQRLEFSINNQKAMSFCFTKYLATLPMGKLGQWSLLSYNTWGSPSPLRSLFCSSHLLVAQWQ